MTDEERKAIADSREQMERAEFRAYVEKANAEHVATALPACDHSPPPDSAFAWSLWARCACGEVEFRRDAERLQLITDVAMDGQRATDGTDIGSRRKRDAYMAARGLSMASDFQQHWADVPKRRAEEDRRELKQLTQDIGRLAHTQRSKR